MKIHEVMKETGLTKKAIYYYENEGLVRPYKDPENNYRNYTEEDVRKLVTINILRRLDIPIRAIAEIVNHSIPMKEVLKEQLVLTNQKLNQLYQNKIIMNDLITRDIEEEDFSLDALKEFNLGMDRSAAGPEYVGKALEQIFPGPLGKTFAIFYGDFSNVPLDTEERASAWNALVKRLDEMKEIDFPEDIIKVVEDLSGEEDSERLIHWERISKRVLRHLAGRPAADPADARLAREAPVGYYANPENQKKIEGYYRLQNFILNNHEMFKEIDRYIDAINESCGNDLI